MSRHIIEQLKALRRHGQANPSDAWVRQNRAELLIQIKNTVPAISQGLGRRPRAVLFENVWSKLEIFLPRPLVYNVIRPIAVLLIVVFVATTTRIMAVDASYEAQPGDFSYSVLRAAQKTQVAVAVFLGDKNGETKLHIQFASNLATKTKQLVQADGPKKDAQLAVAVADLKSELNSINSKLDETKNNDTGQVQATVVKDVKQNTEQIKNALQDVKNNLLVSSTTVDSQTLAQEVNDTKDLVKDVSIKAMGVMVDKLNAGDKTVSEAEVKQALNKTLTAAASDMVESKQTVEGLKDSMETVKSGINSLATDNTVTSTKEIVDKISTVADATKVAVEQTTVANAAVDQKVTAAKTLLSSTSTDSLAKAMDTLKEVNQATKDAEKISDDTIQKVQTVLPLLTVVPTDSGSAVTTSLKVDLSVSTTSVFSTTSLSSNFSATSTTGTVKTASGTVKTVTSTVVQWRN